MSATRDVTIWCDGLRPNGDPCGQWEVGDDAKSIRQRLGAPGKGQWLVGLPGGGDLCPEHRDQRNAGHMSLAVSDGDPTHTKETP